MIKSKYILVLFFLSFFSCSEYTPRPKGYPRVVKKSEKPILFEYQKFSLLYSDMAKIDEVETETKSEFWFNISYPEYNAIIYCTYMPITRKSLSKALDDSYQLAYSHALKADGITQTIFIDSSHNKSSAIYDIKGSVAVPVQFYITDSISNFLRGSLYFDQVVKADSIASVTQSIRQDILQLIQSLEWKKSKSIKK